MNSDLHGTITKGMIGKMHGMKHVCKKICLSILKAKVIVVFLKNISITLIDKTDGKDLKRRENYWMKILKLMLLLKLILNTVSDQFHAET